MKTSYSFKIIKHKFPQIDKITLYYDYIYSRIQYGIEVYGKASSTTMKTVQTQQNRALKILYNRDFCTHTLFLHRDLNILLVKYIFKIDVLKFVYKQQNNLLPNIFNNFYTTNEDINSHNTRQREKIHLNKITKTFGQDTMKHVSTTYWNQIPTTFTQFKTVQKFCKIVKQHILSFY